MAQDDHGGVQLSELLRAYFDASTSQQDRARLEGVLVEAQKTAEALVPARAILEQAAAHSPQAPMDHRLCFFACSAIEANLCTRSHLMRTSEILEFRGPLLHYLSAHALGGPIFASAKAAKCVVDIGKLQGSRESDKSFLDEICSTCLSPSARPVGVLLLCLAIEEVAVCEGVRPRMMWSQVQWLRQTFLDFLPRMTILLAQAMSARHLAESQFCMRWALRGVASVLAVGHPCRLTPTLISRDLLSAFLEVIEAAVAGDSFMEESAAVAAECVTELLIFQPTPPAVAAISEELGTRMVRLLQLKLQSGQGLGRGPLAAHLCDFLVVYILRCLEPAVAQGSFPLGDFLSLVAQLTLGGRGGGEGLLSSLSIWEAMQEIMAQAQEGTPMATAVQQHADGLAGVAEALVKSMLRSTNADALDELDDSPPGSCAQDSEGWDDDGNGREGQLEGKSEIKETIFRTVNLLSALAYLSAKMRERIRETAFAAFESTISRMNGHCMDNDAADAAYLFALIGATSACPDGLKSAQSVVFASRHLLSSETLQRDPRWLCATDIPEAASLAIGSVSFALESTSQEGGHDQEVKDCLDAAVHSLSCFLGAGQVRLPTSEEAKLQAAAALLKLCSALPPALTASNDGLLQLLRTASEWIIVTGPSPKVAEGLYTGLSALLLPPQYLRRLRELPDLAQRGVGFQNWLVTPVVDLLLRASPENIVLPCRVLGRLCRAMISAPPDATDLLVSAIDPALHAAVALVKPCLSLHSDVPLKALLWFTAGAIDGLGKSKGVPFAIKVVEEMLKEAPASSTSHTGSPLRLIAVLLRVRAKGVGNLLLDAAQLALDSISRSVDLVLEFLSVAAQVWGAQWQCLVATTFDGESAKPMHSFTSERAQKIFNSMCSALCALVTPTGALAGTPPEAARQAIRILCDTNRAHKLFHLGPFRHSWLLQLGHAILRTCSEGPMDDELVQLAGDVIAADETFFAEAILPEFLSSIAGLRGESQVALVQAWVSGGQALHTRERLQSLLNDTRFYAQG
jgi:hypothetical protein